MEALEALETARAMRYLKPDPVPEELLQRLVWGATRASSPGNSQGWEFVVVRERATKEKLGAAVRERMGARHPRHARPRATCSAACSRARAICSSTSRTCPPGS